jgi:hypothetical protein
MRLSMRDRRPVHEVRQYVRVPEGWQQPKEETMEGLVEWLRSITNYSDTELTGVPEEPEEDQEPSSRWTLTLSSDDRMTWTINPGDYITSKLEVFSDFSDVLARYEISQG